MLVLTRKRSEMIRIGEDIVIKVIKTGNGAVKLGIEAPQHVRVLREELCHEHLDNVEIESDAHHLAGAPATVEPHAHAAWATSDQFPQPHVA